MVSTIAERETPETGAGAETGIDNKKHEPSSGSVAHASFRARIALICSLAMGTMAFAPEAKMSVATGHIRYQPDHLSLKKTMPDVRIDNITRDGMDQMLFDHALWEHGIDLDKYENTEKAKADPKLRKVLLNMLDENSRVSREYATHLIGMLEIGEAAPKLEEFLGEQNTNQRLAQISAISLGKLSKKCNDAAGRYYRSVFSSSRFTPEQMLYWTKDGGDPQHEYGRKITAVVHGAFTSTKAPPGIRVHAAMAALQRGSGDVPALKVLMPRLMDAEDHEQSDGSMIRKRAPLAIRVADFLRDEISPQDEKVVEELLVSATHASPMVRHATISALSRMNTSDEKVLKAFRTFLNDAHRQTRLWAGVSIAAQKHLRDPLIDDLLKFIVNSPDDEAPFVAEYLLHFETVPEVRRRVEMLMPKKK